MTDDQPHWAAPGRPDGDAAGGPPPPPVPPGPGYQGAPGQVPGTPGPTPPGYPPAYPPGAPTPRTQPMYVDFRPGIVPLRPLTMSDIFGGTTQAIRGNPAATLGLGLVTTLVFVVPATLVGAVVARSFTDRFTGSNAREVADTGSALGAALPSLASVFAVFVMSAFMAHVVGQGVLGARTSLGQTWTATKGRILPAVGSALLILAMLFGIILLCLGGPIALLFAGGSQQNDSLLGIGVVGLIGGVLAVIVLALLVGTRFSFASSAIVLEGLGVRRGLGRSWRLTSGSAVWRVLGIRLLVSIAAAIVGAILAYPIRAVVDVLLRSGGVNTSQMVVAAVFVSALTTVVTGALTTPFTAGADTLLYIDQRIRREALDVQLVQTARSRNA